ncbi:MAG: helix-turn-helix domain-containing protein, partial [Chloroflexi bacterium]|nr:helix-turn-helix domain-containing protein [Chloroflexota bacterium]
MLVVFEAMSRRRGAVTDDDLIFKFRLALFAEAGRLGNVRAACRVFGVHPSTFYRWRGPVLRSGLEMLRPRERRPPRMPNQASVLVEQRVVAFVSGHESCRELSTKSAEALGVTRGLLVWTDKREVPPVRLGLLSFEP